MPKKGQTQPISEEDRLRYVARLAELKQHDPTLTLERVGKEVGLKKPQISKILRGKQRQSVNKPQLDRYFGGPVADRPLVKQILSVVVQLDEVRLHKLHERALALLDDQRS